MKRVIFLGDSITLGYGLEDASDRYSTVFCRRNGYEEVNYGMTGTLIARAGVSIPAGSAFIDRYLEMQDGDLVVVFGGANDYWWSDTPVGNETSEDPAYFYCALKKLCQGLLKKYPYTPILFIAPYQHVGYGNYEGGKNFMDASDHDTMALNFLGNTLQVYCDLIRKICGIYDIPVLDLSHCSGIDLIESKEDRDKYTLDGCHPSSAGHKILADCLYGFVKERGLMEGE